MRKWLCGTHLARKIDMLGTFAGALAYSFVLSVVPFMVIAFALTTELIGKLDPHAYQITLSRILPLEKGNHGDLTIENHITRVLEATRNSGSAARTIGLLFALYTSFNLMNQIVRTLLFIFDDPRKAFQWSWRVFSKTVALLAVWMLLLLTVTVSSVFGIFVHASVSFLSGPWHLVRDLAMGALLFGAVFATYHLVPSRPHKLRTVCEGATVASIGLICAYLVFTSVLPHMIGLNLVYRALGSIVVILLWALTCAWSLIIGACWMVRFPDRGKR